MSFQRVVAGLALSLPSALFAAGYGINEQSASYLGTAFAGRGSNPVDGAIAATNPAGIAFVEGISVSAGMDVVLQGGKFDGTFIDYPSPFQPSKQATTTYGRDKNFVKTSAVPFGYFSMPVIDGLTLGLAGYAPYGIKIDYDDNWVGKSFGVETSVEVMAFQGTVAYEVIDGFSVGVGLIFGHVSGKLTSSTSELKGSHNTFAWNVGALWNVTDSSALGLTYHSQYNFNINGDVTVFGAASIPAKLAITMPEKVIASFTQKIGDQWQVMADITWTRWSRFREFDVLNAQAFEIQALKFSIPVGASLNYVPMNWKNTMAYAIGTSYQLNDSWLLRAGFMYDGSPVSDANRTVRSPDGDRFWFTLGANWKIIPDLSIDFALAYVKLRDGTIDEEKYALISKKPTGDKITGNYSAGTPILGVQLNYTF